MATQRGTRELIQEEFDRAFYRETYSDIGELSDPLDHFLNTGWIQGRDPSGEFSVFNYLLKNDDVLFRHVNPFVHFVLSGRADGRKSYPHIDDHSLYLPWDPHVVELLPIWFDEEYYLNFNPDLSGSPSLLAQYLVLGWVEGRDPCPAFSTHKYLWKYSDVWLAGINPLVHFLRSGQAEGRQASPAEGSRNKISRNLGEVEWLQRVRSEFDPEFYTRMYPSTRDLPDPFDHYRSTGWLEGRDPNANFSVRKYLSFHTDVLSSGQEPFYHYIRHGIFEGRATFPSEAAPEPAAADPRTERSDEDIAVRAEFDEEYYRSTYPELASIEDCFLHYMTIGWKEGRNPSRDFDTKYYLRNEGDIRQAGINPFRHYVLHGKKEGRRAIHRVPLPADQAALPKISVIVPNYNHAKFLPERLRSIVDQNYPKLELLILDDCSIDNSREVIRKFADSYDGDCRVIFNEVNSGNVFSQWRKGLSLATGELIWICESDDTCDKQFLRQIVYLFQDPSVRLAFGDIQFVDRHGNIIGGMSHFRESAEAGIWNEVNLMPAARWFTGPLAVRNLIANVGGAVFRKPQLDDDIWETARSFRVAGDWFLYLMIAGGGQIAYAPEAKAYFRQHPSNTSVKAFEQASFYEELGRFHTLLRERWDVPLDSTFRFYNNIVQTFEASSLSATCDIAQLVSLDQLIKVRKKSIHIAVAFLNFNVGGGEIFPIEVLNELHKRGFIVSAVVQTLEADNSFVRDWLHPEIPVYASSLSPLTGPQLARDAGFDIIHSHNIWSEFHFLNEPARKRFKYVVTLHGSYEVSHVQPNQIARFLKLASWAYIADRNLEKFHQFGLDTSGFRLIPNGMARRLSRSPVSRAELGVPGQSTVFLFAARSHPEKGWLQAAEAFDRLVAQTDKDVILLMAGDGREPELVREKFGHNDRIRLLGFRGDVDDLLELADFALLPSRFAGESMPLFAIQSVLAFVPLISTNVGSIKDMLEGETGAVGVAIDASTDDDKFIAALLAELRKAIGGKFDFSADSFNATGRRFSVNTCVDKYLELYGLDEDRRYG